MSTILRARFLYTRPGTNRQICAGFQSSSRCVSSSAAALSSHHRVPPVVSRHHDHRAIFNIIPARKFASSSKINNELPSVELTATNTLVIHESGKEPSRLHNLWLRDHCRCPKCFHPITKQRLIDSFKLDSVPVRAQAAENGLTVTWKDRHMNASEHMSFYPWSFLGFRQLSGDTRQGPNITSNSSSNVTPFGKQYWTDSVSESPPTVQYEAIMNGDGAVLEWLENVNKYGFCFVKGVPPNPEDTQRLIERIAFIRVTHYGGFWDFTADLAHGDTAYTNIALKAHTDTTYFTDPCGLQIFHMLSHTEGSGGESLLVDGFRAAAQLGQENPSHLDTLARTKVPTHAVGDDGYHYTISEDRGNKIVEMSTTGSGSREPVRIAYNNDDRGTVRSKNLTELDDWYAALTHWDKILTSPNSEYWFQLEPGTVVVIDNHRVLHGRAAFTGKRRMCGAYIGADDYLARLQALRYTAGVNATASTGEMNQASHELHWRL